MGCFVSSTGEDVRKHIIALGADDAYKQECDPFLLGKVDCVIVDSRVQEAVWGPSTRYAIM